MELYHPFLINYYGMEVEIKGDSTSINNDKNPPKAQESAPGNLGSLKKKRSSLFQSHNKDYLELTVYTDYFEQFLFSKEPEDKDKGPAKKEDLRFWLRNKHRPDQVIKLMYRTICGLSAFHSIG